MTFSVPSSNSQSTDTQANVTAAAQAKADAEIQKAKEKDYYDAVTSGTKDFLSALGKMASIIGNYDSSKAQDLANSINDITTKVKKVALINPPPDYEHVQTLYKQGAHTLVQSMVMFQVGLKSNDESQLSKTVDENGQASKEPTQAIDELNRILTSHGISY